MPVVVTIGLSRTAVMPLMAGQHGRSNALPEGGMGVIDLGTPPLTFPVHQIAIVPSYRSAY